MILARQTVGSATFSATTSVTIAAPVEGNLLVATAADRSGAQSYSISGTGWIPVFQHFHSPLDSTMRKSLCMWYKQASASEPLTITTTPGAGAGANVLTVVEYEGTASEFLIYDAFKLHGYASTGYNAAVQEMYAGLVPATTSDSVLIVGAAMTKTDQATEVPYTGWYNEYLQADIEYDMGASSVDLAFGSLFFDSTGPGLDFETTADNPGTAASPRGGISAIAVFVPEVSAPPPATGSLLTESGATLLTESGSPLLL